ncbi:MAG: hypothetical protein ACRYGP_28360 [Janthinobacterium lividum]
MPSTGQEGSYPPSAAVVEPMTELANLLAQAGIVGTSADLFQVTRAIRGGQLDFDATDTGTADAVICQIGLAHAAIAAGLPFTFIKGSAANTGNAVPTLTITDVAGNNGLTGTIVKSGGGAIAKGDLPGGALITVRARAPGVFALVSLLTISDVLALVQAGVQSGASSVGRSVVYIGTSVTTQYTFTVPVGVTSLEVWLMSAGGQGGASGDGSGGGQTGNLGGGGGGGALGYRRLTGLTPGQTITVTMGAYGGSVVTGLPGSAAASSSFGSFLTCTGGGGGPWGGTTYVSGGAGGAPSGLVTANGDWGVQGGQGGNSGSNSATVTISDIYRVYGRGGQAAMFGIVDSSLTGTPGRGYGPGGTGSAGGVNVNGASGAPSLCIVRW